MNFDTTFSDRERALVQRVADERGIPFEQAVTELTREAIAQHVRRRLGRAPAQVVPLRRRGR